MKRRWAGGTVVALLLFAAALLRSQVAGEPAIQGVTAGPSLDCPEIVDIGPRERGESVSVEFRIGNRGDDELTIDDIRASCSCTVVGRPGERGRLQAFKLQPGDDTTLTVNVKIDGNIGDRHGFPFTFRTNDPARPKHRVMVVASEVRGGIYAAPTDAGFGVAGEKEVVQREIDILDDAPVPRGVVRAECSNPQIVSVKLLPADGPPKLPTARPAVVLARLEVTVATAALGNVRETVSVFGPGRSDPWVVIPVSGRVCSSVECLPFKLVLPQRSGTGPVYAGRCLLRSPFRGPVTVVRHSAPPGLAVDVTADAAGPAVAQIVWNPVAGAALAGTTATVAFQVVVGGVASTVEVPVRCVAESTE